jgi:hypothetical protein
MRQKTLSSLLCAEWDADCNVSICSASFKHGLSFCARGLDPFVERYLEFDRPINGAEVF